MCLITMLRDEIIIISILQMRRLRIKRIAQEYMIGSPWSFPTSHKTIYIIIQEEMIY